MEKLELAKSFGDSLSDDTASCISDLAEIGLDAIMDEGVLKEVPVLSTAVALYKIGNSLLDRHNLKKLIAFLNAINKGIVSEEQRQEYRAKFQSNEKFRNQEIGYLLVLIARYTDYNKPEWLAKLYLAYLDGTISWEEMTMYAEVIDRFLLIDYRTLTSEAITFHTNRNLGAESILRLVALGLMAEDASITINEARKTIKGENKSASKISSDSQKKKYKRTEFGRKLVNILK